MTEEETYYVGVKNPVEVRKTVLEASKELVEALHRYEKFKEIRDEKNTEIAKLKSSVKEINKLVGKLKSALPKSKISVSKKKKPEQKQKDKTSTSKKKNKEEIKEVPKKKLTEIDKLESELEDIESKLNSLG
jgi:chromosome segregation ATPase